MLASPKALSFDNKSKNYYFSFVLCSLNRTFAAEKNRKQYDSYST